MTIQYDQLGEEPQRTGNASHYSAPANVFRTSDGQYVSLSGSTQATFVGNAKAIDRPDLLEDPKFDTNQTRFANREEINEIYTEWFATHTQPEAIAAFEREQGTLAPIYSVAQVFEDPQFAAREAIVPVQDDDFGEVRLQAVIPKLTNNPGQVRHTARSLGADNLAVYEEYLDLNADEVSALQEKGII